MFALGGMAAEVRLEEELSTSTTDSILSKTTRHRWEQAAIDANPDDFDAAYEYVAVGLRADSTAEVERDLTIAWNKVLDRLREDTVWQSVERVAKALLKSHILSASKTVECVFDTS